MLRKILTVIAICLISGCASQSRETTYRDYMMNQDFSLERGRQRSPQEIREECAVISKEIVRLNGTLSAAKGADGEYINMKEVNEIKWLKKRAAKIKCKDDFSMYPKNFKSEVRESAKHPSADYAGSKETKSGPAVSGVKSGSQQPVSNEKEISATLLSFDECFQKCRELTDRTKGECFDTCLVR